VAVSAQASKVITPAPSGQGTYLEIGGPLTHDNVYNVKDFGAKGDGVTGDNLATIAALDFAKERWVADNNASTTIYFPAGDYALLNTSDATKPDGITYVFPDGFGNLTIKGDGANLSRFLFTGSGILFSGATVFALRLSSTSYEIGTPVVTAQQIHDISFVSIGINDDNPDLHQSVGGEETHGFYVEGCDRLTFSDVMVSNIGDEMLIVASCRSVLFDKCRTINNLFTESVTTHGAGIDIMNGCENVIVQGCRLFSGGLLTGGSAVHIECQDQVGNIGIKKVVINGNVMGNCIDGVSMQGSNGHLEEITISGNVISDCDIGIKKAGTSAYNFKNISIVGNTLKDVHSGIEFVGGANYELNNNILISDNIFSDVVDPDPDPTTAIGPGIAMFLLGKGIIISGNNIDSCDWSAIVFSTSDDILITGGRIINTGITDLTYASIDFVDGQTGTDITVSDVIFRDVKKTAVQHVTTVKNCDIQVKEDVTAGKQSLAYVKYVLNNTMNYGINFPPSNCKYIGNNFINSADPGDDWINLAGVDNGIISNNYFSSVTNGTNRYAIETDTTTTNCIISTNNARDYDNGVFFAYGFGKGEGNVFTGNLGKHKELAVTLSATDDVPVNTTIYVVGSGAGIICTATPSIADGSFVGQEMSVMGTNDTNSFAIQDEDTLAGSNVQLGDTSRVLTDGDVLMLKFDGTYWQETLWVDN
jgi:hypothetical protein